MSTYAEKKWGDCSNAVAYSLNFVQMCYTSGSWEHFYAVNCDICEHEVQIKPFEYTKGNFSKKDYFILDMLVYGVSENLKNDMLKFGVSEDLFIPIYTKKHDSVLGYQIKAKNILPLTYKENGMYEYAKCDSCGRIQYEVCDEIDSCHVYNGLGYPIYITQEALDKMQAINGLGEREEDIIISIDLYNYLIEKYPRLECRPVFLGTIYNDQEYLRKSQKSKDSSKPLKK